MSPDPNKAISKEEEPSCSSSHGESSQSSAGASTSSGTSFLESARSTAVFREEDIIQILASADDDESAAVALARHLQQEESAFVVEPLLWCPHLDSSIFPLPERGLHVTDPCFQCESVEENWVCLQCFKVGCGRFVNKHMIEHGETEGHPLVLSYSDLSVWCYSCQQYVHNKVLKEAKESAYQSKFGQSMAVPESWRD